ASQTVDLPMLFPPTSRVWPLKVTTPWDTPRKLEIVSRLTFIAYCPPAHWSHDSIAMRRYRQLLNTGMRRKPDRADMLAILCDCRSKATSSRWSPAKVCFRGIDDLPRRIQDVRFWAMAKPASMTTLGAQCSRMPCALHPSLPCCEFRAQIPHPP